MVLYILELRQIVEVDGISTIQWRTLVRSSTRASVEKFREYYSTIYQQKHLRVIMGG